MSLQSDEVLDSLLEGRGASFKGDDFRLFCGPLVYLFMFRGKILYAGMSGSGIGRPSGKNHHHADRARAICDEVLVWPCKSPEAARKLESLILNRAKPLLNQSGKYSEAAKLLGVSGSQMGSIVKGLEPAIAASAPAFAKWDGK